MVFNQKYPNSDWILIRSLLLSFSWKVFKEIEGFLFADISYIVWGYTKKTHQKKPNPNQPNKKTPNQTKQFENNQICST